MTDKTFVAVFKIQVTKTPSFPFSHIVIIAKISQFCVMGTRAKEDL